MEGPAVASGALREKRRGRGALRPPLMKEAIQRTAAPEAELLSSGSAVSASAV